MSRLRAERARQLRNALVMDAMTMTATEVAERQHAAEQEWNRERARQRAAAEHHVTNELANRALRTLGSVTTDQSVFRLHPGAINWFPAGATPRRPGTEFVRQNGVPLDPLADDREAKAKARVALWRYLDDQQREHLFCFHHFAVKGSDSKMVYKISSEHTQGNINRDDGARFCITRDELPVWDLMLAQKLMIEDSEPRFLELANRLDELPF